MKRRPYRHANCVQFLISKQLSRIGVACGDTMAVADLCQACSVDVAQSGDFHRQSHELRQQHSLACVPHPIHPILIMLSALPHVRRCAGRRRFVEGPGPRHRTVHATVRAAATTWCRCGGTVPE